MFKQQRTFIITSLIILIATLISKAGARSVYVISDTQAPNDTSIIQAYEIQDSNLVYQTDYKADWLAVGLTIDTDSEFLFVTHEEYQQYPGNVLEIVNAKTMQYVDSVTAPGASNLAGIVFDQTKQKVYTVDRKTPDLYVYSWEPRIPRLVLDEQIELEGLIYGDVGGAWGIALDEENHRLWVTSNQTKVRFYNTDDWSHNPSTDYITLSQKAIGIALDLINGYVYTGTTFSPPSPTNYLSKYNLSDGNETTENIGAEVIGIAVDQETGLVYLTTFGDADDNIYPDPPEDRLFVYNSNLDQQWVSDDIGNPAGVAVAGDVSYKPPFPALTLTKVDDVNCVTLDDYVTYTISYDANGTAVNDINIVDYLPQEVDFNSASDSGTYDSDSHTVTWEIGDLGANDSNSVTLTVRIKELAAAVITNLCEIETESNYIFATCCVNPCIIYVDVNAPGSNTGASWENAFIDLQDALEAIRTCGCKTEIWVAEGIYRPTQNPTDYDANFALVEGVAMYGGFAGTETNRSQRNWITNETVLTGDIDNDGYSDVYDVMTASGIGETTVINGFIIRMGRKAGVQINSGSPTIEHNRIKENTTDGIKCINQSSAKITNCEIQNNRHDGIYCEDSNSNITNCLIEGNSGDGIYNYGSLSTIITNNIIRRNKDYGIFCDHIGVGIEIEIKNNWIHNNGIDNNGCGILFYFVDSEAVVRNNTVTNNDGYGIGVPYSTAPNIGNCIIWGNGDGALNGTFNDVTYSCIQGGYFGNGNIDKDPLFYYPNDPNDYHLGPNSPCIDKGDPCFSDFNETDIDGECRIIDGDGNDTEIVDMGADEYDYRDADFNGDGVVNFLDYAELASAWRTTLGNDDYNDICDLEDNNSIDYNDLAIFCEDWLWQAGWTKTPPCGYGMGRGSGLEEGLYSAAAAQQPPAEVDWLDVEEADIEELIKWLDEIWLNGELKEIMTEDEYIEFRKSIEKSPR